MVKLLATVIARLTIPYPLLMITLPGYQILAQIYESANSLVYRGIPEQDKYKKNKTFRLYNARCRGVYYARWYEENKNAAICLYRLWLRIQPRGR
jgi:hypothetical protein